MVGLEERLKLVCEHMLCSYINISTTRRQQYLVLAEQHCCNGLKEGGMLRIPPEIEQF
jgi:uncharacterized protein (DUF169 family)